MNKNLSPRHASLGFHVWLTFAAVLFMVQACTSPDPSDDADATTGSDGPVIIAYSTDMQSVNELTTNNTALHTALHYYMMFLPLLEEQPDWHDGPSSFKPRLASDWSFSEDRLTLTFQLRPDAVWSDGVPITAEDVRWTWLAQRHPDVAWEAMEDKDAIRDVEIVAQHTVRFHFTHAYANQLIDAVQGVILPKHAWSQLPFDQWRTNPDWFLEHLVVSGPYAMERWDRLERIVLRRNERGFADPPPAIERIIFEITPDEDTRAAQLRAGTAHVMEAQYSKGRAATVRSQPRGAPLQLPPEHFRLVEHRASALRGRPRASRLDFGYRSPSDHRHALFRLRHPHHVALARGHLGLQRRPRTPGL